MSVHANSRAAYHESGQQFSEREQLILATIRRMGHGTDKQIAAGAGFSHKSAVQPRITELLAQGALIEYGNARDPDTGKTVRVVCTKPPQEQQMEIAV